jgi:hypothetical protein
MSPDEPSTCGDYRRPSVDVARSRTPLALCLALLDGPSGWAPPDTAGTWASRLGVAPCRRIESLKESGRRRYAAPRPALPAPSDHAMPQIHSFNSARFLVCMRVVFPLLLSSSRPPPQGQLSASLRDRLRRVLARQPLTQIWYLRKDGQVGRARVASQFVVRGDCCLPISVTTA